MPYNDNNLIFFKSVSGCVTNNKCIRPDNKVKDGKCIKFHCDNGNMITTEKGKVYDLLRKIF